MVQKNPNSTQSAAAKGLAFFRISVGIILLIQWSVLLSSSSMLTVAEMLAGAGVILICMLLVVGIQTRFVAITIAVLYILQWVMTQAIGTSATMDIAEGQVFLLAPLLLVIAFSNADRSYSFTMYRNYGSFFEWEDVRIFPITILKMIVSGAYIGIIIELLVNPLWMNTAHLRSALIGSLGTGIAASIARSPLPLWIYQVGVLLTILMCIIMCIFIWIPHKRVYAMLPGVFFHIAVILLIGEWWLLTLPAGYLLFLSFDPEAT